MSFEAMMAHQIEAAAIVSADPNVQTLAHMIQGGNQGRFFIQLKPRKDRTLNADQIIEELRPKLAQVPGFRVYLQNPPIIRIGARNYHRRHLAPPVRLRDMGRSTIIAMR